MHRLLRKNSFDLTGKRFGLITCLESVYTPDGRAGWLYRCDCGQVKVSCTSSITGNSTKSCGCWQIEQTIARSTTHHLSKTKIYWVWHGMRDRCYNTKNIAYANYGGRGIHVCQRWLDSVENFYADMGAPPAGMSIDRVDVNGCYGPDNCRWATIHEQASNKRNSRHLTAFGETKTLAQWSRDSRMVVSMSCVLYRLKKGMSFEDAVSTPKRK